MIGAQLRSFVGGGDWNHAFLVLSVSMAESTAKLS